VGVVIICTVLTWSSVLVVQGVLLTGALVAIIQMTSQLNAVSVRLAVTNLRLQEARIAFERMYAFASVQPEFIDEESTDAGEQGKQLPAQVFSISMSNVAFRFPGRTELLKDVRLELRRGEIVALKGESGSGKTTILQMLQRLYAWERGEVVINENILLENIGIKEWRGIVAVVPQHIKIFNGTVIENICLAEPNEKVVQDVIAFCREYGFDQIITQFPQGYATLVGEEGVNLSGGQRQILALARALYQQPQMLLLDECTSALDRVSEERVLHLLRQCKHSMAILMITHRTDNLDIADRVYTLKNGTVAEEEVIEI
jgi:ATP-binding cassette subfamily B protein